MKKKRKENERDRDKEDERDKAGREIMESWGGTRDRKKRSDEQTPDLAPKAIRFMLPILITNAFLIHELTNFYLSFDKFLNKFIISAARLHPRCDICRNYYSFCLSSHIIFYFTL